MPAAVRRNARGLIILLVSVILGTLVVVAQQREPMTTKKTPVSDRIENAIKAKEPKFKLAGKLLRNNEKEKYALLGGPKKQGKSNRSSRSNTLNSYIESLT